MTNHQVPAPPCRVCKCGRIAKAHADWCGDCCQGCGRVDPCGYHYEDCTLLEPGDGLIRRGTERCVGYYYGPDLSKLASLRSAALAVLDQVEAEGRDTGLGDAFSVLRDAVEEATP